MRESDWVVNPRRLVYDLIHKGAGAPYEADVRSLHAYLRKHGEEGAVELRGLFLPGLLSALKETAETLGGGEDLALPAYAVGRYWEWRYRWQRKCDKVDSGALDNYCGLLGETSFLSRSTGREEVDAFFARAEGYVVREDGTLLEDCLRLIALALLWWLRDALEGYTLPTAGKRALALSRLLYGFAFGLTQDLSLYLVASYQGDLFPLNPEMVHTLRGREGEAFLRGELDRLAKTIPMMDLSILLWEMDRKTPPNGSLAAEVLAVYRQEVQARFSSKYLNQKENSYDA